MHHHVHQNMHPTSRAECFVCAFVDLLILLSRVLLPKGDLDNCSVVVWGNMNFNYTTLRDTIIWMLTFTVECSQV